MAIDREKILQAAQKLVDKKRFDKAIQEYQRIIHQDPNDARTLLKIGDLQARIEAYAEAIATYDRVGQFYAAQGFALKAIAVYKQIRELIRKHAPQLEDRYGHITPKLAQIYTELGLTTDALAAYDEVAVRLQRNGRDRDAVEIFRKMVALDATNPLPHLRLAEACCRIQSLDEAIDSFWTAAELLIRLKRRDDALKVIERILHFRVDPRFARVAAELYLERGTHADGLQSLAKLQLCFQADPKNLDVLALLARAFVAIGQAEKSLEVRKEMARFAEEQGRDDVFRNVVDDLLRLAPDDPQVRALLQRPESRRPAADSFIEDVDVETANSSIAPPPSRRGAEPDATDLEEVDFDDDPVAATSLPVPEAVSARGRARAPQLSAPEVVVVDDDLEAVEELTSHPDEEELGPHIQKAIEDAESFRGLRLYDKAIESLRIGLELDPTSLDVREVLRDVLAESGDRDGTIAEMLTLAELYLAAGDVERASSEVYQVLEAEPQHQGALDLFARISGGDVAGAESYGADNGDTTTAQAADPMAYARQQTGVAALGREAPLPSYDLEELPSEEEFQTGEAAVAQDESAPPSFELPETEELTEVDDLLDSTSDAGSPEVEEALDEAEFFGAQGLVEDARTVLLDALARVPGHPLVLERLRELERRGS
ncbi:MAG: tetratricopeptide repeat protein, partial [Deltaproteobacteria bacterium]|nr:tetratricopeptide repeat protein [Deltaproteobacteria bacterium]